MSVDWPVSATEQPASSSGWSGRVNPSRVVLIDGWQTAPVPTNGKNLADMDFATLLFPLLILALFIPILISGRKQRQQIQQMQQMQQSLTEGDVVITTSGLRGTVVDASYEETVDLEIADGVVTTWLRAAIRERVHSESGDGTDSTSDTARRSGSDVASDSGESTSAD